MTHIQIKFAIYTLAIGLLLSIQVFGITKVDLVTPPNSRKFGTHAVALPTGRIVVTDPEYSIPGGAQLVGAVYLFNGSTGEIISTIKGSTANDMVGSGGVTVLENGNYVISSPLWNNGSIQDAGASTFGFRFTGTGSFTEVSATSSLVGTTAGDKVSLSGITPLADGNYVVKSHRWTRGSVANAGAVTFCKGTTRCTGVVSASNSLVGSSPDDFVGATLSLGGVAVTALPNGGYVVTSPFWRFNGLEQAGAATFGHPSTGVVGSILASNSIYGSKQNDHIGGTGVSVLASGNYVVRSLQWDNGSVEDAGAATFGNKNTGVTGVVSASNSLIGSSASDRIGEFIDVLPFGNYVVRSNMWDNGTLQNAGAVTFGDVTTGVSGVVSSGNSLVGTSANDEVGKTLTVLSNGNYVVGSPKWDNSGVTNVGAATFVTGTTGLTGFVNTSNSLVGTLPQDSVGLGILALTNGNYVVASPGWNNGNVGVLEVGASTLGNGTTGIVGVVSPANSLIGSQEGDRVGSILTALSNGNYVVSSPDWKNGGTESVGAATYASGTAGITGFVTTSNSLIGSSAGSHFGRSIMALSNGNYIVGDKLWDNGGIQSVGLITYGNGASGTTGVASPTNSIIGSTEGDNVGEQFTALPNGNFLIITPSWHNGSADNAGAITFGNGQSGIIGVVSPSNSLVGSTSNDRVGNLGVTVLENGNYVVHNYSWDNGSFVDAGSITYGDGNVGVKGEVSFINSVVGTTPNAGGDLNWSFDESNDQLVVGRPNNNKVTFVTLTANTNKTKFDFDGDSKTDVSIFRPASAEWWVLRSSDGGNHAFQFGQTTDTLVPSDYTGDGKADVAFWRESTGEWFILRSEDSSFYGFPFGASGDIPAPGDYDGDGKSDAAVFRPSSATWFINRSSDGNTDIVGFGVNGDKPVIADYDGDGKDDIAIYRPSNSEWWINRSTAGVTALQFGQAGDKTVQGDYTGDGKADVAFYRPSTGSWFVIRSEDNSFFSFPFGASADIPSPGDYDGDGQFDAAVFRPSNTTWYLNGSTSGTQILSFGVNGDIPLPSAYVRQ